MSKISKAVSHMNASAKAEKILRKSETVVNFMGGDSYKVDPLTTLRMVTASSIFGEPSYYRDGATAKNNKSYLHRIVKRELGVALSDLIAEYAMFDLDPNKNTAQLMEECIDKALSYDFKATLEWAVELRNEFYIRLNPQIIMVRAALHPDREKFTKEFNGAFAAINKQVMFRADDVLSQMAYFLYLHKGEKNNIPSIIKRSWANKISSLSRYQVAKYKNHEIGMINAVRLCHAKGDVIGELMTTGTIAVDESEMTWENLRAAGKSWETIFTTVDMGHMALLRNVRGFLKEVDNFELAKKYMEKLKSGVLSGKQFPFRYYSAYKAIKNVPDCEIHHKQLALDTLEECIDICIANMPKLKGKTMCLSDNSGSAWGTINSEYGTVTIAEIDNLSAVITAMCSDEGYVGKFGDTLKVFPISKRRGALEQMQEITNNRDSDVGGGTEGGIWVFFNRAITKNEHWDNIFIYSDQQAGTGGLYGTPSQYSSYKEKYSLGHNINVYKLVVDYRNCVNSKVNVFSIQTAGYDNNVLPNYSYRVNLLYGWTGKEAVFADFMIREWDQMDAARLKMVQA